MFMLNLIGCSTRKSIFLLGIFIFSSPLLNAQLATDFKPLRNKGRLPADLITSSSVKFKADIGKIKEKTRKKDKQDQTDFYLRTNFEIDDLIRSGKVLIDPTFSDYFKSITKVLLKGKPELEKKLRFYVLRSPMVNAFATNQGIIFVTLGTLAQVENEAQLAFILSHEIAHVEQKHGMEEFLLNKRIERGDQKVVLDDPTLRNKVSSNSDIDEKELVKHKFSREQEQEADDLGLERYLKTQYDVKTAEQVFDVLRYSNSPFDDIKYERSFLETDFIKIPNSYYLDSVSQITGLDEDDDDSERSHPNLAKRRVAFLEATEKSDNTNKKDFLVSETIFNQVQRLARFELPQLFTHSGEFQKALYAIFLIEKLEKPTKKEEKLLDYQKANALYNLAKYSNRYEITAAAEETNTAEIEGESQQVFSIFGKMPPKEINCIALAHVWKISEKYPKESTLERMRNNLLEELVELHEVKYQDFKKEVAKTDTVQAVVSPQEATVTETVEDKNKNKGKKASKYAKIKATKKKEKPNTSDWWQYSLGDILDDDSFKKGFIKWESYFEKKPKDDDAFASSPSKNKIAMGVNKVVFVEPVFSSIDNRSSKKLYLKTEEGYPNFEKLILENAKAVGLSSTVISSDNLKTDETEKFNDIVALNEWFTEQSAAGKTPIVPTNQSEIDAIAQKYGTDYFVWTGLVDSREQRSNTLNWTLVFWPIGIANKVQSYINSKYTTVVFVTAYNVKTGKNEVLKFDFLKSKANNMVVGGHLYDAFRKISKKPSKK
jgi:beta-barrel assembly-enhancing protease